MPYENTILQRACVEEFEQLYNSLYSALLTHNNVLFLAPEGVQKVCSTVKALQDQPAFRNHRPRIILLMHDPYVVSEMGINHSFFNEDTRLMRIVPGKHTNHLIRELNTSPDLVAGTPAKILELIQKGYIQISHFDAIIIEDVSSFQYLGYYDHLQQIIETAENTTKVVFTSSLENQESLPLPLRVKPHLVNQLRLNFPFRFHAFTLISEEAGKPNTLFDLLCELFPRPTMVYCNHRGAIIRLQKILAAKKMSVGIIHGGLEEVVLEDTLAMFRNGSLLVLLTTDMAIQDRWFPDVKYLVHYQMPLNNQSYQKRNNVLLNHHHFATAFHIIQEDEDQPDFIHTLPDVIEISHHYHEAPLSYWKTIKLEFSANIVLENSEIIQLLASIGKLHRDEIGLIEKIRHSYYIAIAYRKAHKTLERIDGAKFNNQICSAAIIEEYSE